MNEAKKMVVLFEPDTTTEASPNFKPAPKLTPRQQRTCEGFARRGRLWREEVDRISGASNGPEVMRQLKAKGLEWRCERIKKIDRDGRLCEPGLYSITGEGWQTLKAWGFA